MPSEDRAQHVTIRLARGFEFIAEFNDVDGTPSLLLDEPAPLGTNRGPNAAAVLGAAIGNCLAASLAFCVRKARVDLKNLTAEVTTHVARTESGHFRISSIDVELMPELGDAGPGKVQRCGELFEDFCIVTASVRKGIPVNVTMRQPVEV